MCVLVKGLSASGEAQYAYVAIAFDKYEEFLKAEAAGSYDLSAFGTILCHGLGAEPPIELQKEMEEKYDISHDLEQQIMDALDAIKAENT